MSVDLVVVNNRQILTNLDSKVYVEVILDGKLSSSGGNTPTPVPTELYVVSGYVLDGYISNNGA
jgi:hypothetical protein